MTTTQTPASKAGEMSTAVDESAANLTRIEEQIMAAKAASIAATFESLRRKAEIGRLLVEAKSLLPHGQFDRWIREKFNFSRQWASVLVQLHIKWPIVLILKEEAEAAGRDADLGVRAALEAVKEYEQRQSQPAPTPGANDEADPEGSGDQDRTNQPEEGPEGRAADDADPASSTGKGTDGEDAKSRQGRKGSALVKEQALIIESLTQRVKRLEAENEGLRFELAERDAVIADLQAELHRMRRSARMVA
ncbi:MAG: DUF3102 domain-containing protein [Acetobacteraceae bacterium]|nr:DUF3102 domain-containing protein [Acetobacteraceae bacterium]